MRQLSGLDDAFLALEGPATPLHVTSLTLLEGSTLPAGFGYDAVLEHIADRIRGIPQFREKLEPVPLGLDHPYWRVDEHFDLEFHVRHSAVPPPGGDRELAEVVARLHARPLDRARPLWEMYVIEGLAGGDVGLLTKMHHAAIDGVAGIELAAVVLDASPEPTPREAGPALVPEPPPPASLMLARGVRGLVRFPARAVRGTIRGARQLPALGDLARMALPGTARRREADGGMVAGPSLQAPPTPFNAPVTAHRRVAWTVLDLERIKAVKRARDTTVNDVIMAITAGAVRRHLVETGALPDRPLQAMVPISVRAGGEQRGNRVTTMIGLVPTHLADPLRRLAWVADQMRTAKEHDAVPADVLADVSAVAAPVVAARAARVVTRLRWANRVRLPFNLVISNIPGPPVPLYVAGARVKHMIPVSAIHDGLGFNVTIISHEADVDVGLVADREMIDDLWHVADLFAAAAEELYEAAEV